MSAQWSMIVFGLVATSVWLALHAYLGWSLTRGVAKDAASRKALRAALGVSFLLTTSTFYVRQVNPDLPAVHGLLFVAYTLMGAVSLLVIHAALRDWLWWLAAVVASFRRGSAVGPSDPEGAADAARPPSAATREAFSEDRRRFLRWSSGGVLAATAAATGVGVAGGVRLPRVVEVSTPIEGLPASLEGLRIAHLSDLHLGPTLRRAFCEEVVARTNRARPDLVVITGDLVDGYPERIGHYTEPLDGLEATHGVYYVTGNHEYYWEGPRWVAYLQRERRLQVLLNEHRTFEHRGQPVVVAGVTDHSAGRLAPGHREDARAALRGAPAGAFRLFLAHQPLSVHAADEQGFDLFLAGHTHGGQYYPWNAVVGKVHPFSAGLYRRPGKGTVFISQGTGYWGPPMRIGTENEIPLLVLRRA